MKSILSNGKKTRQCSMSSYGILHIIISFIIIIISVVSIVCAENWTILTELRSSLILPAIFIGNMFKIIFCKYYIKEYLKTSNYLFTLNNALLTPMFEPSTTKKSRKSKKSHRGSVEQMSSDDDTYTEYQRDIELDNKNYENSDDGYYTVYIEHKLTSKKLFYGVFALVLFLIIFMYACIMLGAPMNESYEQTFLLSAVLTLLTVMPTLIIFGLKHTIQLLIMSSMPESREIFSPSLNSFNLFKADAIGTILGAWCGTAVVPLDWDCEWQNYPIPNIIGAIIGLLLSNLFLVLYNTYFADSGKGVKKTN